MALEPGVSLVHTFVSNDNRAEAQKVLMEARLGQAQRLVGRNAKERAHMKKVEGNEYFSRGMYREATDAYTMAIDLLGDDDDFTSGSGSEKALYVANRAACWLKRRRWWECLEDCNMVLRSGRSDSIALKALFRRGKANEAIGDADAAYMDYKRCTELEPGNREAMEKYERLSGVLYRATIATNAPKGSAIRRRQTYGSDL
eukprot:scaffold4477_cov417-Prasinococcus_capsulatus_cf.AAC.6